MPDSAPLARLGLAITLAATVCAVSAQPAATAPDLDVCAHEHCRALLPPRSASPPAPAPAGGACADESVIDVLWCYTPAALAFAGSDRNVLFDAVTLAMDDANTTFANTGLPFGVRTVGFVELDYDESGDHLAHLQNTTDGVMDEIHALRDSAAGDIVALVTETGSCGLAYVAPNNAAWGFQMNTADCIINLNPFRHELGHNLGSQHFVTDTYGYFSYSSGHRFDDATGTEIGTAMGGNNIPHYSNPNVLYDGAPTGVAIGPDEEADNFTAFSQTVPLVADFRCSTDTCDGDVTLDFSIGFADLNAVLADWGNVCGACPADLDGNGAVGFVDLNRVLDAWGPCP